MPKMQRMQGVEQHSSSTVRLQERGRRLCSVRFQPASVRRIPVRYPKRRFLSPHPPPKKGESACRSLQCSCHSTMRCRLQYFCFHSCMHGNTRTLARHICVRLESSQMYLQLKWSSLSLPFHPLSLHLKRGSWACDLLRMPLVHKCKLERVYCMGYGKELLWPVVRMECLFVLLVG